MAEGDLGRDQLEEFAVETGTVEVDGGNAMLTGKGKRQLMLGDGAELDKAVADPRPAGASVGERLIELFAIDEPVADQQFADPFRLGDDRHKHLLSGNTQE
jgi:hypothetical protein